MESTNPPGPSFPVPRRVFTAPVYSAAPQSPPSSQSTAGIVDTLYAHPSVKIVSFTAGTRPGALSPRAAVSSALDVEPGSLPSSSQFEITIAAGHFRIYRAPGSVAFLSCGSALQPILPKSQAWCVDEASSKFILQIRRPQYWRIEVPVISPEDVQRAQLLRDVFDKILQFEKTECPFRRSFTVELPEPPLTPVKKRPWTPAPNSLASLPPTPVTPVEVARLYRSAPKEFISGLDTQEPLSDSEKSSVDTARGSESNADEQSVSSTDDDFERTAPSPNDQDGPQSPKDKTNPRLPKPLRQGGFLASRCVTAPPQLTLVASPPSKLRKETPAEPSPKPLAAPRLQF
ncbi:inheritance of peroxisomes protein 1-domain-containing protein [Cercophora scortea]|uniref:Inheritance of peroxisomes protein 1 n=1 Tax=Cercophora scortea TaxID=314031 RepID=A0AAE0M6S9_9PEZI|nr:inheritance of peroxisomes protein 1-domain-containing protein [Cercophora scortea]